MTSIKKPAVLFLILGILLTFTGCTSSVQRDYKKAEELLAQMDIAELRNAYPSELSGGEMRRLSIARALIRDPGILLADEPTGDLDDENTHIVLSLLRKCADEGKAVLLVTHEAEAAAYADRIYRMEKGALTLQEKEEK